MENTTQKWLIGCGAGCAGLVLVIVFLVAGAVVYIRDKVRPLQEASETSKQIVAAYGRVETFVPPPDGAVSPQRMEIFLSVRAALREAQDRLDGALTKVDLDRLTERNRSFGEVLQTLNDVGSLIKPVGEYIGLRNRALMERHMGLGEYAYIYTIAYHSWLGHPPEEGPPALARLRERGRSRHAGGAEGFTPEAIRDQYRKFIVRMLENQADAIKDAGAQAWRDSVKQEIERINRSLDRVAWQDNLPQAVEEGLKPYRGRLESSYRASTNCFELLTFDGSRQFEWSGPGTSVEIENGRGAGSLPAEASPEAARGAAVESGAGTKGTLGSSSVSYSVRDGVTAPMAMARPMPAYTDEARRARAQGVVMIQAIVHKDGSLGSVRLVRRLGYGLDESAVNTVTRDWTFRPARLNGKPVDVQANIEIVYRLP